MTGTVINGRYEVIRHIGGGGMAQVYLARDLTTDRHVAVKLMNTEHVRKARSIERFKREGRLLCKLHHPNLVNGLELGRHDDRPFIAMEYIEGPSIAELIELRGSLSRREALKLLLEVALALNHLYLQGSVQAHRDIKPTNILIDPGGVAKVTDFGIAKAMSEDESVTMTSSFLGSPHYMSPEQITDPRMADIRSDIYALGAVFYEMLTGEKAYPGKSTKEILDAHFDLVPPQIEGAGELVSECNHILELTLAREVSERFQTPRELVEAVAPLIGDVDIAVPRVARGTVRLAFALGTLGLVSVLMVGFIVANSGADEQLPVAPVSEEVPSEEDTRSAGANSTNETVPPTADETSAQGSTGENTDAGASGWTNPGEKEKDINP